MNKALSFIPLLALLGLESQAQQCVDASLIDPFSICLTVVDPVCGCNGVTYSNACEAENWAGVTSWTEGPCAVEFCQDVAGIDFGECDFVLGIAQVNGVCTTISGCDWVVNGVDYSPAFFQDEPTCTMARGASPMRVAIAREFGRWNVV